MVLTAKGLCFLVAAIIFFVLAIYGSFPSRADWPRGIASFAWFLAMVGLFLWTAGK